MFMGKCWWNLQEIPLLNWPVDFAGAAVDHIVQSNSVDHQPVDKDLDLTFFFHGFINYNLRNLGTYKMLDVVSVTIKIGKWLWFFDWIIIVTKILR